MLKRGLSLAIITMMVSTLGFASFGDSIKKAISDEELADAIKIEQPAKKTIKVLNDKKVDNLTISGTITSTSGVGVTMKLERIDGIELVESASSLKYLTIPKVLLDADFDSDKEKAIIKKFSNAYEERVIAELDFEKAEMAYEKAKKENKSAAKILELKEDMEKAGKVLAQAKDDYRRASAAYLEMSTVTIFSDTAVGGGKMPTFSTMVKNIKPGLYHLSFIRSDNDQVIKVHVFEIEMSDDFEIQTPGKFISNVNEVGK